MHAAAAQSPVNGTQSSSGPLRGYLKIPDLRPEVSKGEPCAASVRTSIAQHERTWGGQVNFEIVSYASRNAVYQLKTGRVRRVAAAYDQGNRSFPENWPENFRQAFAEGGGEILTTRGFEVSQDTMFLQIARELLALGPDGVLIVANSMDSALLCRQLRKLDESIPITLSDWGGTERLLELGGQGRGGCQCGPDLRPILDGSALPGIPEDLSGAL
jgi:ABC-type branched-subunit amino acid transport system substrate-binding protein